MVHMRTEHLWQQQRLLIWIKQEPGLMIGFMASSCVNQRLGAPRAAADVSEQMQQRARLKGWNSGYSTSSFVVCVCGCASPKF